MIEFLDWPLHSQRLPLVFAFLFPTRSPVALEYCSALLASRRAAPGGRTSRSAGRGGMCPASSNAGHVGRVWPDTARMVGSGAGVHGVGRGPFPLIWFCPFRSTSLLHGGGRWCDRSRGAGAAPIAVVVVWKRRGCYEAILQRRGAVGCRAGFESVHTREVTRTPGEGVASGQTRSDLGSIRRNRWANGCVLGRVEVRAKCCVG
jgi:hypothetical protein